MTTIGLAFVGLGVTVVMGWFWISPAGHLGGPSRIGFSYGVGLVWVTTMMGVVTMLGLPLARLVAGPVVVLLPIGWWLWRRGHAGSGWSAQRRERVSRPRSRTFRDPWWWSAAGLVGLLVAIVVARTVVKPIQAWDAWSTYATKAKMIYFEAAISPSMFESVIAPNYPLGIPLQEVWMAWFVGAWDDVAVKLVFPGYLVALLCVVYGELRDLWPPRAAMWGTLFVASLPLLLQHGQDGYTDLPLAYFVVAGAVALKRYARDRRGGDLALASILAAGMVWTREDGVVLVVICAALLLYDGLLGGAARTDKPWGDLVRFLGAPGAVWGAWALAKAWMAIPFNLAVSPFQFWSLSDRIPVVFESLATALFLEGNWMILWALVVLALVDRDGAITSRDSRFLLWPVILYLGVVGILTVGTALFQFVEVRTVLNRLILHVAPLAALWVVLTYGRWWGIERWGGHGPRGAMRENADV